MLNQSAYSNGAVVLVLRAMAIQSPFIAGRANPVERTDLLMISSIGFPVSSRDEIRLFANTSGDTSVKIWFVARRRKIRAGVPLILKAYNLASFVPSFPEYTPVGAAMLLTCSPCSGT